MALYYSDENNNLHKVAGNFYLPDNIERVETIYDKDSTDSNINLGYTNGLTDATTINFNVSKYKKLIAYYRIWGNHFTCECDLTHIGIDNNYNSFNTGVIVYDNSGLGTLADVLNCKVNSGKNQITIGVYFLQISNGNVGTTSGYYCYKIEGIY